MKKLTINAVTGEAVQVDITEEELPTSPEPDKVLWSNLRSRRQVLLCETDYLALADATLTDEMRAYRQALRDLPANTTDPANPVWPVKPGGTN